MSHFEYNSKAFDGLGIYFQGWKTEGDSKAVIGLVHGLGEHSGRYTQWSTYLNQAGYSVLASDLRGHGKSEGKRGHSPSFEAFMEDISLLLKETEKQFPGLPCFLYGHSLGGVLVINFILRRKPQLAGVVVTSPGLRTAIEQQKVKIAIAKSVGALFPEISTPTGLDAKAISHDQEVVTKYVTDPLVHGVATLAMAKYTLEAIPWAYEHAGEWTLPLLLMHGEADKIAFVQGSREFADKVRGDCTLKVWPGLAHETHNEPEKDLVFAFLKQWLDGHVVS